MSESAGVQKRPKFKGKILLCDDNELNQHVIKSMLTRLGFGVTTVNDGKECVELVSELLKSDNKPFDLIFMDIYMPVMGGIEAADKLSALEIDIPIVALTASAEPDEVEAYRNHGMPVFLSKPVVPEQMWDCLYKFFTPLGFEEFGTDADANDEAEKRNRLLTGFVKRNQNTYADMSAALKAGDTKTAHRLAHTVRGLAGLMGEKELQEASRVVEYALANGDVDSIDKQMAALERELSAVLTKLAPLLRSESLTPAAPLVLDKAKAADVFERLEPLLLADSAASRTLVAELREIPGASGLIEQIEDYEFEAALEKLFELKKTLEA